jgi:hypothetical protein
MPAKMLGKPDLMGYTCLHYVAMGKSVNAAKALVIKNPSLSYTRNRFQRIHTTDP